MRGIRVGILCALAAVAVASLAACGTSAEDTTTTTITPGNTKGIAEEATWDGIHSGHLDGLFTIGNRSTGVTIRMGFFANFRGLGEEGLPQFELALKSQGILGGRSVDFNGSLILHSSDAQFIYGPSYREYSYNFDKATFEELRSKFEEAQEEEGEGDVAACLQAAKGFELARLVHNFKSQGRRKNPDGIPVFLVSGEIDVPGFVSLLVRLVQEPACGAQMRALGIPSAPELEAFMATLKGRVTKAEVTLAVDKDGILHDIAVHTGWKNLQGKNLELNFAFLLREINKPIDLPFLPGRRPLDALLRKFGSSQAAALEAGGTEAVIGFLKGIGGGMTGQLPSSPP